MRRRGRRGKPEFLELEIESFAAEGVAVAKRDGMVYFVKNAVPGDKVKAKVYKKKKSYAEALVEEIIEPSPNRIEPPCRYFDYCGGCSRQAVSYADQLHWKTLNIKDAFDRIGKVEYGEILPVIESPKEFGYRNKMDFTFGAARWMLPEEIECEQNIESKHFALGLHIPGRFDKIVDIDKCLIQTEYADSMLTVVRDKALEMGISAHHARAHKGFLRYLVIRYSLLLDKYMVILITDDYECDADEEFVDWFLDYFENEYDKTASVIHAINNKVTPTAVGKVRSVRGEEYLIEEILGVKFRISPFSFFQTNPFQLNRFIGRVIETAAIEKDDIVWDLYCGTGSITLPAAKSCKKIIGIELIQESIGDAKSNAKLNGIENADFFCEDLHKKDIPDLLSKLPNPDTVIIDPPRQGMHKHLLNHLLEIEAPNIVYVSCNPATQARDCALLAEKYDIGDLQPVDLFPQTHHTENITKLRLKKR